MLRSSATRLYRLPCASRLGTARVARTMATSVEELTLEEEKQLAELTKSMRKLSFNNAQNQDISPELKEKVNKEFASLVRELVDESDLSADLDEYVQRKFSSVTSLTNILEAPKNQVQIEQGNMYGAKRFPFLVKSEFGEPFTKQELFTRQLFHANMVANMGAVVKDAYKPHNDRFKPPSMSETSLATLIAAGAHLGSAVSRVRASCLPFVHGIRNGIHIIDMDQTLTFLKRASTVVEGIARKGGVILFVGTRNGQERIVEVAAKRANAYYVHTRWTPGSLSNAVLLSQDWARQEVDMADSPTNRRLGHHLQHSAVKPDVVILLNPVENRDLLRECSIMRVPTVGIIDTDSEPSLVSYPIPANDDSLRACELLAGVLSKAALRGRESRIAEHKAYKAAQEQARSGTGFNSEEAPKDASFVTPAEEAMARS